MDVDSFIYVEHMLDRESYVGMDLFDRKQTECLLFKTPGVIDLLN